MSGQPERQVTVNGETFTEVKAAFEIGFEMTDEMRPGMLAACLQHAEKDMTERGIEFTGWHWDRRDETPVLSISGRGWVRKGEAT